MSELLQKLYGPVDYYPWPKVKIPGKWRCRVTQQVRETELSERLAKFKQPGESYARFGSRIGASGSQIGSIIKCGYCPAEKTLFGYAERLGVEPEELIGSVNEKTVVTIEDFWFFLDDHALGSPKLIEPFELLEEYTPLDLRDVPDEYAVKLMIGIIERAKYDSEYGRKKDGYDADLYLDRMWSYLTGEDGKKRPNRPD